MAITLSCLISKALHLCTCLSLSRLNQPRSKSDVYLQDRNQPELYTTIGPDGKCYIMGTCIFSTSKNTAAGFLAIYDSVLGVIFPVENIILPIVHLKLKLTKRHPPFLHLLPKTQ